MFKWLFHILIIATSGRKATKTSDKTRTMLMHEDHWLVGFVALRPKSTAMVIAGRSVHLTTLFPGQA